jgi:hypothetical protein
MRSFGASSGAPGALRSETVGLVGADIGEEEAAVGSPLAGGEELRALKTEPLSGRAPLLTTDAPFAHKIEQKEEQSSCWSRTSAGLPSKAFSNSNNFNIVWPIK